MQYKVHFKNNSRNNMKFCLFQQNPDLEKYQAISLAWLVKACAPGANVEFIWDIDYGCFWCRHGDLSDVARFRAWETISIDPTKENKVTLSYNKQLGNFKFSPIEQSGVTGKGTIHIQQDSSVPADVASVGVSMAGSPALALEAQPNFTYKFTPHPRYWAVFGEFTQGEIIDLEQLTDACELEFAAGASSIGLTLKEDNTWSAPLITG